MYSSRDCFSSAGAMDTDITDVDPDSIEDISRHGRFHMNYRPLPQNLNQHSLQRDIQQSLNQGQHLQQQNHNLMEGLHLQPSPQDEPSVQQSLDQTRDLSNQKHSRSQKTAPKKQMSILAWGKKSGGNQQGYGEGQTDEVATNEVITKEYHGANQPIDLDDSIEEVRLNTEVIHTNGIDSAMEVEFPIHPTTQHDMSTYQNDVPTSQSIEFSTTPKDVSTTHKDVPVSTDIELPTASAPIDLTTKNGNPTTSVPIDLMANSTTATPTQESSVGPSTAFNSRLSKDVFAPSETTYPFKHSDSDMEGYSTDQDTRLIDDSFIDPSLMLQSFNMEDSISADTMEKSKTDAGNSVTNENQVPPEPTSKATDWRSILSGKQSSKKRDQEKRASDRSRKREDPSVANNENQADKKRDYDKRTDFKRDHENEAADTHQSNSKEDKRTVKKQKSDQLGGRLEGLNSYSQRDLKLQHDVIELERKFHSGLAPIQAKDIFARFKKENKETKEADVKEEIKNTEIKLAETREEAKETETNVPSKSPFSSLTPEIIEIPDEDTRALESRIFNLAKSASAMDLLRRKPKSLMVTLRVPPDALEPKTKVVTLKLPSEALQKIRRSQNPLFTRGTAPSASRTPSVFAMMMANSAKSSVKLTPLQKLKELEPAVLKRDEFHVIADDDIQRGRKLSLNVRERREVEAIQHESFNGFNNKQALKPLGYVFTRTSLTKLEALSAKLPEYRTYAPIRAVVDRFILQSRDEKKGLEDEVIPVKEDIIEVMEVNTNINDVEDITLEDITDTVEDLSDSKQGSSDFVETITEGNSAMETNRNSVDIMEINDSTNDATITDTPQNHSLWTHLFAPENIDDVLVCESSKARVREWVEDSFEKLKSQLQKPRNVLLKEMKRQQQQLAATSSMDGFIVDDFDDVEPVHVPLLILKGDSGSCKSSCIYALMRQLHGYVHEINTGTNRGRKDIFASLKEFCTTQLVHKLHASKSFQKGLVLVEDSDVLFEQDKTFWTVIQDIMNITRRPIVMTCEDTDNIPKGLLSQCEVVTLEPVDETLARNYLWACALSRGFDLSNEVLQEHEGQVLRKRLTELQSLCCGWGLTGHVVRVEKEMADRKRTEISSLDDAVNRLELLSVADVLETNCPSMLNHHVQENEFVDVYYVDPSTIITQKPLPFETNIAKFLDDQVQYDKVMPSELYTFNELREITLDFVGSRKRTSAKEISVRRTTRSQMSGVADLFDMGLPTGISDTSIMNYTSRTPFTLDIMAMAREWLRFQQSIDAFEATRGGIKAFLGYRDFRPLPALNNTISLFSYDLMGGQEIIEDRG